MDDEPPKLTLTIVSRSDDLTLRKRKTLGGLLLATLFAASAQAAPSAAPAPPARNPLSKQYIYIYGQQPLPSCGQWTADRKGGSASAAFVQSWVLGILSGYNWWGPGDGDVSNGSDTAALYGWLDEYCRTNALDNLFDAAVKLIGEMERRDHPVP